MASIQPVSWHEVKLLSVIMFVALCGMLGVDIHLASLPHIMTYLHTDKTHMQQSISLFLLGLGGSLLFYGPLSDRYGRKPLVIIGMTFAIVTSVMCAFSTSIQTFLLLRLCQGIGSGVCMGLGRTMVADLLQGARLAAIGSYFALGISLSPLIAPTLGGYIQHGLGWQANFIVLGGILTLALVLYSVICPETNQHLNKQAVTMQGLYHNYAALLSHAAFIRVTLMAGVGLAISMVFATLSAFIFQNQFHLSPITYGWLITVVGIGAFLGKLICPFLIARIGSHQTLGAGLSILFLAAIALIVLVAIQQVTVFFITLIAFVCLVSQSLIIPNALALALSAFPEKRGAAGALYGSLQMLFAFVSSAVVGLFSNNGVAALAMMYGVLGVMGILLFNRLPHHDPLVTQATEPKKRSL